jgi:hypothetical protein
MSGISLPLSTAMKARAKAAIDAIEEDAHNYTSRTPRLLRALILRQDDSDSVRAAMTTEGWFADTTKAMFTTASSTAVDVS